MRPKKPSHSDSDPNNPFLIYALVRMRYCKKPTLTGMAAQWRKCTAQEFMRKRKFHPVFLSVQKLGMGKDIRNLWLILGNNCFASLVSCAYSGRPTGDQVRGVGNLTSAPATQG